MLRFCNAKLCVPNQSSELCLPEIFQKSGDYIAGPDQFGIISKHVTMRADGDNEIMDEYNEEKQLINPTLSKPTEHCLPRREFVAHSDLQREPP